VKRFREDNTEGYDADALAELNRRYEELAGPFGSGIQKCISDWLAERILAQFDAEAAQ